MVKANETGVVEIEVDGPHNGSLIFMPASGRKVRGRFVWQRVKEPLAAIPASQWPGNGVIPGQRIGLDLAAGVGFIIEPLHDDEHTAIREKIAREGLALPPARQEFAAAHVPTWLYWMKRAVEGKAAKVVAGEFPATIDGEPKLSFFGNPTPDKRDAIIEKLIDVVTAMLPANKKKELLESLGATS
jgi:hypothetical protein